MNEKLERLQEARAARDAEIVAAEELPGLVDAAEDAQRLADDARRRRDEAIVRHYAAGVSMYRMARVVEGLSESGIRAVVRRSASSR